MQWRLALSCGALHIAALVFCIAPLFARDFHDPYTIIDPVELLSSGSPGAVMDWEYNYQAFRGSDLDDFQLNMIGGAGLFRAGEADLSEMRQDCGTTDMRRSPGFALGMRYGAYLFTGPGGKDTGTPHFSWLMNSIQFQYGLHAAYALSPQARLLAEYSRLSNHPLGRHPTFNLSDVAYDRIAIGVGFPRVSLGTKGTITTSARIAYVDLWDAWEAQGTDTSRVQWKLRTGFLAVYPFSDFSMAEHNPQGFIELHSDVFTQHDRDGIDATFSGRLGVRLEDSRTFRVVDIYLDTYFSRDTEKTVGEEFPVGLIGIGFRIGNASRSGD